MNARAPHRAPVCVAVATVFVTLKSMLNPLQQIADQIPPAAQAPSGTAYAGFKPRAMALAIDAAILFALGAMVDALTRTQDPHAAYRLALIGNSITVLLIVVYFTAFTCSRWQATPGKRALRLCVTTTGGIRLSPAQSLLRCGGMIVSAMVMGMGFIMAAFTADKTALHDLIAETRVVHGRG